MTKKIKLTLIAVAAGTLAASAPAAGNNGDLLLGFTSQSGNDLIYDLGNASTLTDGKTWNLTSLLSGFDLTTVEWGVIGDQKISGVGNAWATTPVGNPVPDKLPSISAWGKLDTAQSSIIQNFATAAAGQSLSIDVLSPNSWNSQTIVGSLPTQYHNVYLNPNVAGLASDNFYHIVANNSAPVLLGGFSLAANGVVTYNVASANPPTPLAPKIVSVTRTGGTTSVFFTTTNGNFTYTLYYTNSAGLTSPVTNWPKSPSTLVGNGNTNSLTDITTDATRFYRIGVQ
jgi:hypothetical protein